MIVHEQDVCMCGLFASFGKEYSNLPVFDASVFMLPTRKSMPRSSMQSDHTKTSRPS